MHSKFGVIAIAASRGRVTLLMCALALCIAAGPRTAHAAVLKSEVVGAHYKGNAAAQVELNRVKSRLKLNNLSGALDAADAAARKDSLSGEVFDQMGILLLRQGNYRTAYSAFNRAAVLAPEQAPIWNRLAQVSLTQLGYEQEGLNALRFAFAADSQYASAYYTEFVYHWARCEFDLAAGSIQHARDIEQDEGRSLIWYSAQLGFQLTEGNYPQIARALEVHLAQATNDITAKQHLVHARRGMGQNAGARDLLNELLQVDDRQPVWLVEAGLVRRALGDRDSALVFFNRALKADSTSYDAGYNRALELLARRDTVAAWSQLRRLRNVDAENFLAPLLASRIARAEGGLGAVRAWRSTRRAA
jgi:tetratricopeptide (TPR) repeat protein